MSASTVPEPQRRERKKQQTRNALVRAAMALFSVKGYEHTAIREITDAVDVSERTFFRYFASKEDLVLSFARDSTDALLRELVARPAGEPPLVALRGALHMSVAALTAEADEPTGGPFDLAVMRLVEATPSLLAAHLRHMHDSDEGIARVLAQREGVDPATDLRPRCAAAVFNSLLITATREWGIEGSGSVEVMLAVFDAYAGQIVEALSGHWS